MLKNILIKTAEIINRDDLISELNSETITPSLQNDIMRLISYYNYTIEKLCENYFPFYYTQTIHSDKNRRINFLNFKYHPLKTISVTKEGKPKFYSENFKYLTTTEACTEYEITYTYLPEPLNNLIDKINIPHGISTKMICYGIASEFLACKNNMEKSEYWNNKFMLEIFKSKTSRDRKLKPTFYL